MDLGRRIVVGLICLLIAGEALARGPGSTIGPQLFDGKVRPKVTPEEYKTWPGDNRTIQIGEKWLVPSLVGDNFESNIDQIKNYLYGFKIRKIHYVESEKRRGTVLSQNPKENELVSKPTYIDITVSHGSDSK